MTHSTEDKAPQTAPLLPEDAIPEEWQKGDIFLDRYEVVSALGQGAMGKVYKIFHRGWNQYLAVKSPKRDTIEAFGGAQCFEHECETWIRVGIHPNTVACYYARRLGGIPRVFAEYVDGRTLHEWIYGRKLHTGKPADDLLRILLISTQIAWGLNHAHRRGVIHQDVKPANIMMTSEGSPKVTDFGLARRLDYHESGMDSAIRQTTVAITGMTPAYCSPEQAFRDHITHRTDLWSWGLVVFEMFTGEVVWPTGSSAAEALERWVNRSSRRPEMPEMPPRLVALLRQIFQSNPSDRPSGFEPVSRELISIYEEIAQQAFPLMEPPAVEATGDALNNRAISLMDFGKHARALKVWERALREAPGHPQSTFNYALLRWREGAMTDGEALATLRAARDTRPNDPLPVFLELRFHLERGDVQSAAECLATIDEFAPDAPGLEKVRADVAAWLPKSRAIDTTWDAHQGTVTSLLLDTANGRLFSGGEDNRIGIWEQGKTDPLLMLEGHTNTVTALAYSPTRDLLASVSMDRRLRVWRPNTGECLHTHVLAATRPRSLCWHEDRGVLLVGDTDGTLYEVSPLDGPASEPVARIPGGLREMLSAPMLGALFAAAPGGDIHILSMADYAPKDCLHLHASDITAMALSPNGKYVASSDTAGALIISASDGGSHISTVHTKGETPIALAFAGSGKQVLALTTSKYLRLWHAATGRCLWSAALPAPAAPLLAVSPDGAHAWAALTNNTLLRAQVSARENFDSSPLAISQATDTRQLVDRERELRQGLGEAAAHYRDGRYSRAASEIGRVRQQTEMAHRREVLNSWLRLYAKVPRLALRGTWEGDVLRGHHGAVRSMVLSLQANYLISGGNDATIRLWDLSSGKLVRQFTGHAGPVRSLALGDTQECLVSSSEDGTLKIWNVRTGRCERTMQHPGGAPEAMALSPDGRILATAGWELHFWDLRLGTRVAGIAAHEGGCTAVLWARSGRFVVSGGADSRIAFWDPETGKQLGARACPHGPVTALSLSPFETILVSSGGNPWDRSGKVCVWDVSEGAPARLIEAHSAPISMAELTMDNRFVLTAAGDGELRVHTVAGETVRHQPLTGGAPCAWALANDASRLVWSDGEGVLRSLHFDWELKAQDTRSSLDSLARKLFSICALGLRPLRNKHEQPAPAGARQAGWPLQHEPIPRLDSKSLQRINYLCGCAGLGCHTPPALESAAMQLLESLKPERK